MVAQTLLEQGPWILADGWAFWTSARGAHPGSPDVALFRYLKMFGPKTWRSVLDHLDRTPTSTARASSAKLPCGVPVRG